MTEQLMPFSKKGISWKPSLLTFYPWVMETQAWWSIYIPYFSPHHIYLDLFLCGPNKSKNWPRPEKWIWASTHCAKGWKISPVAAFAQQEIHAPIQVSPQYYSPPPPTFLSAMYGSPIHASFCGRTFAPLPLATHSLGWWSESTPKKCIHEHTFWSGSIRWCLVKVLRKVFWIRSEERDRELRIISGEKTYWNHRERERVVMGTPLCSPFAFLL